MLEPTKGKDILNAAKIAIDKIRNYDKCRAIVTDDAIREEIFQWWVDKREWKKFYYNNLYFLSSSFERMYLYDFTDM